MADDTTQDTANRPVAYFYFTKPSPRRGGTDRLVRIGAVFAHRSGKGRTLLIDALPVDPKWDGRLVKLDASDLPDPAAGARPLPAPARCEPGGRRRLPASERARRLRFPPDRRQQKNRPRQIAEAGSRVTALPYSAARAT